MGILMHSFSSDFEAWFVFEKCKNSNQSNGDICDGGGDGGGDGGANGDDGEDGGGGPDGDGGGGCGGSGGGGGGVVVLHANNG